MKQVALEKADDHLALARAATQRLDLSNGFKAYEEAWSQFLSQTSRFYSKMEQGSKGCPKSEPWFGKKKHERRKDQLLAYIHHARNCDEHTLQLITARAGDSATMQFPAEKGEQVTASVLARLKNDGTVEIADPTVTTSKGKFVDALIQNPRVVLMRVTDTRFHDSFSPPKEHLGTAIEGDDPPTVARLAIAYLEQMLREASGLPIHV